MIFEPDTIDAFCVRKDGGADLLIVPCGPLADSPETQTQLLDKIECYLGYVNSDEFRTQCPGADGSNTRIILRLDREPPAPIQELARKIVPWAAEYHAAFCVQIKP